MTSFDYAAAFILLASGLIGLVRGATREVTTVVAFVLAAIVSVFALRFSGPLARHAIHAGWLANTAAILAVFIVAYIVLRLIGGALTRTVQQTSLSGLDRLLGFGIGLVRALVVLGGFTLLLNAATPAERLPKWITGATLYPLAAAAGAALRAFAPQGLKVARDVAPVLEGEANTDSSSTDGDTGSADPFASRPHRGHTPTQHQTLDNPVEEPR